MTTFRVELWIDADNADDAMNRLSKAGGYIMQCFVDVDDYETAQATKKGDKE